MVEKGGEEKNAREVIIEVLRGRGTLYSVPVILLPIPKTSAGEGGCV